MNRNTIRVTTVGAALGVAAIFAPAAASAAPGDWVSPTNCAKVATPSNPAGWGNTFPDEAGRAGEIVTTTVVDDDGSLEFNTTEELKRKASYHEAGGLPLAELVDKKGGDRRLTFQKSEGQANWQIRVTGANTGSGDGFMTLVWVAPDAAGTYDATDSGQWWATRPLPNHPNRQDSPGTLEQLLEAANSEGHTTVINHYGISSDPGNVQPAKVNVDNVSFNGCTTNFKATNDGGGGSLEGILPF